MREAGYKETRIFTPETERTESRSSDGNVRTSSVRMGVGAVVDYLAGWMPGATRSEEHMDNGSKPGDAPYAHRSTPSSPLSGKRTRPLPPETLSPSASSLDLTRRMRPSDGPRKGAGRGRLSLPEERSVRPNSSASDSLRAFAQISAAQGYLRHMSSTPNITKPASSVAERPNGRGRPRLVPYQDHEPPPMPTNWLDSVTQAVLGSSAQNAHAGRPRPISRPSQQDRHNDELHQISLALADHTNKMRPMTGYLRAQTAPGEVNAVRVVCRSAPASRSSSRVGDRLSYVADKSNRRGGRSRQRKSRGDGCDDVPSLASTRLENDTWGQQWIDGERVPSITVDDLDCSDDNDDDEDDGEIDLARILVPPKRQKSIRSLRQHLHRSNSMLGSRPSSLRPLEPYILDDDDDCRQRIDSLRERSRRGSMDEGSGWEGSQMPGFEQPGAKRRRGLPSAWSTRASNKS